jgi:hypothetical protein
MYASVKRFHLFGTALQASGKYSPTRWIVRPHLFLSKRRCEARRAPSRRLESLAQTTSSATRPQPAEVSKPQSVPARTRLASPMTPATRSIRSNHLGMLDEIGEAVDYARDEHLVFTEWEPLEAAKLVGVARIRERQYQAAHVSLEQRGQYVLEWDIAVVRRL